MMTHLPMNSYKPRLTLWSWVLTRRLSTRPLLIIWKSIATFWMRFFISSVVPTPIVSNECLKKHQFSTNLWIISEIIWKVKYNYLAENEGWPMIMRVMLISLLLRAANTLKNLMVVNSIIPNLTLTAKKWIKNTLKNHWKDYHEIIYLLLKVKVLLGYIPNK